MAIGLLFAASEVQAQWNERPWLTGGTNAVAAATTNAVSDTIVAPRSANMGVFLSFKSVGTNDSTITVALKPKVGGTVATNGLSYRFSVAANGTTTVTLGTNIFVYGFPEWQAYIENPNGGSALTNVVLKTSDKDGI